MKRLPSRLERYYGSLIGLAVGDALGTAVEFCPPGSFPPVADLVGGGVFNLLPGQWTDDTSMALCLADSLIACGGFDPVDQMQSYLRWYQNGYLSSTGRCFDIGGTTRQALDNFARTGQAYSGSIDPYSAGNGSLMRLAPVVLFFASQPDQAIARAADSSRTTHAAPAAVDACRYMAALLVGALNEVSKEELLTEHYSPLNGYWKLHPLNRQVDAVAAGSFKLKKPPEIKGSGFVVASLEAALWAFQSSNSFEEGCLLAV
ncbi:MAG: ADP-ribosylglycohydrolase family protein, partial [Anaerolineales bacterium]|nr:ADP-ribosylglycohydrolase family protein [Anaerolineales bacterium]